MNPPGSDILWPRSELGHLQMMCTEENELIFSGEVFTFSCCIGIFATTTKICTSGSFTQVQAWLKLYELLNTEQFM